MWFNTWVGARLLWSECTAMTAGRAEVEMRPPDGFRNPDGAIHGGLISAVADQAGGLAVHSMIGPDQTSTTVHLDVQFLRAARSAPLRAVGEVRRLARTVGFASVRVLDGEGDVCATAAGTWSVSTRSAPR
ncbi:PaaI family thioesterase [Nocardioides sp. TF02-7]|uniref:PaaI family thioesterase n=1 Tax=Nocardioides sp. TF02-7 TaxID=2917724 RepID=UPI001F0684EF|nr:PaaI family thioesterase [Nocardioides sp. TF02-7]UMG91197.1 PaaI family thioesterase [Nocardioides sp. TF02-7]